MRIRVRMPGGTFKIKTWSKLRTHELERRVPVYRFGDLYFIWEKTPPVRPSAPPPRAN